MKRITSLIICIILISCSCVCAFAENTDISDNHSVILLRAGGGGSGGGGGGSGGGSSGGGSSHTSGTGRQPTLLESIVQFIMMPFVFFSSTILFYIKLTKYSRKSKKLMKQMMQSDNAWKYKNISHMVNDCFYAVQTAWSDMDMSPASQYMSEELFDSFQTKLNWMAYRNQKNILKNITLINALPVAVHDDSDNSRDYIWFYIKGRMVDYIIDTETQLKVSGNTSPASFTEFWQFIRKDDNWVLNKILQKNESDQIPFNE